MKKLFTIVLLLLIILLLPAITLANTESKKVKMGLGIGTTYGYLGGNIEFLASEHFAFTTGAGFSPDGFNWLAGGRIYFLEKIDRVRPRLGFYYGTVLVEYTSNYYSVTDYDTVNCNMIGIGLDIKLGSRMSLDSELIYLASNDSKEDLRGKIIFATGVHW